MYNEHFGLSQAPFRITPDTGLFYTGGGRGDVLDALVYAITSGEGIVKVVGEVGTGKTMLCRMLEERLPDNVQIAYLANPSLTPEDILHAVALELGLELPAGAPRLQVMHRLQQALLERHAQNRRVVALVEEAQSMPVETLEEIRLLSNLETKNEKLLQIVLFGQPELEDNLARAEIRQLRERITHSFTLKPLGADEIKDYVAFRLRASGYRGRDAFTGDAYRAMSRASEGLTRRVNIIADKAMLAAFAEDTHDVSARHVKVAIRDSEFDAGRRRTPLRLPVAAVLVLGLVTVVLAGAAGWYAGAHSGATMTLAGDDATATREARPAAPVDARVAAKSASAGAAPVADASGGGDAARAGAPSAPPSATRVDPAPTAAEPLPVPTVASAGSEAAGVAADITEPAAAQVSVQASVPAPVEASGRAASPATMGSEILAAAAAATAVEAGAGDAARTGAVSASPVPIVEPPAATAPDPAVAAPASVPSAPTVVAAAAAAAAAAAPGRAPGDATPIPPAVPEKTSPPSAPRAQDDAAPASRAATAPERERGTHHSLLEERLSETRSWLQRVDGRHFSIQLLATDAEQRSNLEAFLQRRRSAGHLDQVFVYRTRINERLWFGVLFGDFSSFSRAREVLESLPSELMRHQPFIRNIRDITIVG